MLGKKRPNVTDPRRAPPRPEKPKIPVVMLIRMFVVGALAVIASIWALWRHYNVPRSPMLVPAPSASEIEIERAP